jgi:hypothetical protein
MFERLREAAGKTATNLSRRQFAGRCGQFALAIAGILGSNLALPRIAEAGKRCRRHADCPPNHACNELGRCVKIPNSH